MHTFYAADQKVINLIEEMRKNTGLTLHLVLKFEGVPAFCLTANGRQSWSTSERRRIAGVRELDILQTHIKTAEIEQSIQ